MDNQVSGGEWTGFSDEDLRRIKSNSRNDVTSANIDEVYHKPAFVKPKKSRVKKIAPTSPPKPVKAATDNCSTAEKLLSSAASSSSSSSKSVTVSMTDEFTNETTGSPQRVKSSIMSTKRDGCTPRSPDAAGGIGAINGTVTLIVKDDGRAVELVDDCVDANSDHRQKVDSDGSFVKRGEPARFENFLGCDDNHLPPCVSKKLSLEEFQLKQKMIEEQNKWRRAMLTKAISDRKKKTLAETEKLTHIQNELQKLDSLVSNDVSILRNQIEVASVEFNEVQKRYEKAEREFVDAKVDLFRKMERKEKLTEHLCKIIEENELRKAKKLSELMDDLELESLRDDECLDDGNAALPQLCAFNDITYSYCTTFRRPSSPQVDDKSELSEDQSTLLETRIAACDTSSVDPVDHTRIVEVSKVTTESRPHDADAVNKKEMAKAADFVDVSL